MGSFLSKVCCNQKEKAEQAEKAAIHQPHHCCSCCCHCPGHHTTCHSTSSVTSATVAPSPSLAHPVICCDLCRQKYGPDDGEELQIVTSSVYGSRTFHRKCLRSQLRKFCPRPVPGDKFGRTSPTPTHILGRGPSGTMIVEEHEEAILGIKPATLGYKIIYRVPSGIQRMYHPSPGEEYEGFDQTTPRVTYLPRNETGKNLLIRLQFCFMRGMTFVIDTSKTTNLDNQVCWSTKIPHKTKLYSGGEYGYPDDNFLSHLTEMLKALRIPSAATIRADINCRANGIGNIVYGRTLNYNAASVNDIDVAYQINDLIIPYTA